MKRYVCADDGVVDLDGNAAVMSWDAFAEKERGGREDIHALWGGAIFRRVAAKDRNAGPAVLPQPGVQTCEERFPGGEIQTASLKQDRLNALYARVPAGRIKTCAPYALAVRSFLLASGAESDHVNVVMDVLAGRVFVTAVKGLSILEERVLVVEDPQKVLEEVRRTCKTVLQAGEGEHKVVLWTNSHALSMLLASEYSADAVRFTDGQISADIIRKGVRFGMYFLSAKDLAHVHMTERFKGDAGSWLVLTAVLGGMVVAGNMMNDHVIRRTNDLQSVQRAVMQEKDRFDLDARQMHESYIRSSYRVELSERVSELLGALPPGWVLERFTCEGGSGSRPVMKAAISGEQLDPFLPRGAWRNAAVKEIALQGRPARDLVLTSGDQ